MNQYAGIEPNDERMEPYWSLAEELDLPVGIHIGTGPPGVIVYTQPRPAFYRYLKGITDAGFGDRVMFGSDQMVWPGTIERGIQVIDEAPFLSSEQKRNILYNNAARFLRLTNEEIGRHHGM